MRIMVFAQLIKEMGKYGEINSHRRLQKAAYLLQQMGAPFTDYFEFGDLHGPFSRALQQDLSVLVDARLVTENRNSKGEYSYKPTTDLDEFVRSSTMQGKWYDDVILAKAIEHFVREDVEVLEVASTWLYLLKSDYDINTLDKEIQSRKPHLKQYLPRAKKLLLEYGLIEKKGGK